MLGLCAEAGLVEVAVLAFDGSKFEASASKHGVMRDGRRFGGAPKPYTPPARPEGKINLADLDSKNMKAYRGYLQGYNARTVTTEGWIIVAAEIAPGGLDFAQLDPMVSAAERELDAAGVKKRPKVVLADAGYWSNARTETRTASRSRDAGADSRR